MLRTRAANEAPFRDSNFYQRGRVLWTQQVPRAPGGILDVCQVSLVATDGAQVFSGHIQREDAETLVLRPTATDEPPIEIPVDQIAERHKSNISNMPAGTLNVLKQEEILDLLNYLLSDASADANAADPHFR